MATCKECLHHCACADHPFTPYCHESWENLYADSCPEFKRKDAFVEQKHGAWEECGWVKFDGRKHTRRSKAGLRCTACLFAFKKTLLWRKNYCPNCGAKMDGGEDDG